MTRFLAVSLLTSALLATQPTNAVGLTFDMPNLTFPPSKPADTTRGCTNPATTTDCATRTQ